MAAKWRLDPVEIEAVVSARHADPFAILGPHEVSDGLVIRGFIPEAEELSVVDREGHVLVELEKQHPDGFFEGLLGGSTRDLGYRFLGKRAGKRWIFEDPYRFSPCWGARDDYYFLEGSHQRLFDKLGAHASVHEGVAGMVFCVWAPHARRVAVVGDFNDWDGRRHPMRKHVSSGVFEIFLPEILPNSFYKFEIAAADGRILPLKADPFAFKSQLRPETASVTTQRQEFNWTDQSYFDRLTTDPYSSPLSIYEVHAPSWRRRPDHTYLSWDELADQLIPYVVEMGFTHIEFLPISEYPFDRSWGYQPIGLFSPTARLGEPEGLQRLVDRAHAVGIGVILDWVPAHFPTDAHGLRYFDGEALYEDKDPNRGFHPDWNTAIYDFGRMEVSGFLTCNADFWLEYYHVDGLRVDAVASMLYLDYSRSIEQWSPNIFGGNTNLEAVRFIQKTNQLIYQNHPKAMMIAEESTAWSGVSQPVHQGGLGFGFKWNMGWMNDSLSYMQLDPIYRCWHHTKLTFSMMYADSENFILPLSHDEVVHGKKSLLNKMPGDNWQKFANLRTFYGYMWAHPGKKLLFMGGEFGQWNEWNAEESLDWHLVDLVPHRALQRWVCDLNHLYRSHSALYERDYHSDGFEWLVVDDSTQSVFALARFNKAGDCVVVVCNFNPQPRYQYRLPMPYSGRWREALNSDSEQYNGSGIGNLGTIVASEGVYRKRGAYAEITVPPLACIYFVYAP